MNTIVTGTVGDLLTFWATGIALGVGLTIAALIVWRDATGR